MNTGFQTGSDGSIGILMVNTKFRRYVGDIGNERTWPFPVRFRIVEEALPSNVVELQTIDLLEPFKRAADELIADGVVGITTTCGFLSIYQRELAEYCGVPVATSSLLQIPSLVRLLPHRKKVGVLTYNGPALNGRYLDGVGVAQGTPVVGMPPDSNFVRWIKEGDNSVTLDELRDDVLAAARLLKQSYPDVGAIVCECTNMAPFSSAINDELKIPVFDVVTMVNWFQSAICPARYAN